jgi:hypothetical protein
VPDYATILCALGCLMVPRVAALVLFAVVVAGRES